MRSNVGSSLALAKMWSYSGARTRKGRSDCSSSVRGMPSLARDDLVEGALVEAFGRLKEHLGGAAQHAEVDGAYL